MPKEIPKEVTPTNIGNNDTLRLILTVNQLIAWAHEVEERLNTAPREIITGPVKITDTIYKPGATVSHGGASETKPPRWRAEDNTLYWYINSEGLTERDSDFCDEFDMWRYNTGNYFQTEAEAIAYREELLAKFK